MRLVEELNECNSRILEVKKSINRFRNYRKWYKPLYWGLYSKQEIEEWVKKYEILLLFNLETKKFILNKLTIH